MNQTFFTAAELAEIAKAGGLMNFPHTKRRVNSFIEREGWDALPSTRKRAGTKGGGGMEYHFQVLPEALQALIAGSQVKAGLIARHDLEAERDRRQVAAIRTSALSAEARAVMDARAEVLVSIDGYAIAQGQTRAWAITRFAQALSAYAGRQEIERRRDAGEILTPREAASLAHPLILTSSDGFQIDPCRVKIANDRARATEAISERSIQRWFKARDERGVIALAPAATKEVKPIPAAFADFLKFYARPSKPTIADAHGEYLKAAAAVDVLQRMPLTLAQVKYILRERMNNIEKQVGREGLLTLRSRLAYVTRTTDDMWPTTIYTADGKTFDAEVADPVTKRPIRPEITTVLDVVTRKVVGISLARSENQRSVAEALRNACVASGIPAIFYVDRGPGYRNQALDADVSGLMGRLGITKMHAAPYGSQAKGRIERPNATIWDALAKRFTTYIGADMDKEAGQKVHKITRRELKEFGESRHLPTWEEFVRLAWAMVEEYNNKIHTSLPKFEDPQSGKTRHMTPNEAWAAHVAAGFEPVPVDQGEVDDLFRPYEIRTASRSEVQWNGNKFFHEALEAYHQKKVMVGYDYHQADRVWVREFDRDSGQPGRLICVARFGGNSERYVPLSFEQAAIENRAKGRLRRLDAKREAIEAERDGLLQIEFEGTEVADFIETAPTPEPAEVALVINNASEAPPAVRRRVFASDADLAVWALANPHEVSARQLEVLRDCMARSNARELFRLSGVDTEALRTLLRAAA